MIFSLYCCPLMSIMSDLLKYLQVQSGRSWIFGLSVVRHCRHVSDDKEL